MVESQIASESTNKRRSQRIVARLRVRVSRTEAAESEDAHTIVVSAHGALLALSMSVKHTELLTLQNPISKVEVQARVVRPAPTQKANEVGVEFTRAAPHFWQIDVPPPHQDGEEE